MWKCVEIQSSRAGLAAAMLALLVAGPGRAEGMDPSSTGAQAVDISTRVVPLQALLVDPGRLADWVGRSHPEVQAARARVDQAEAAVSQSRVIPNPTLQAGVGGLTVGTRNPSSIPYGDTLNWS